MSELPPDAERAAGLLSCYQDPRQKCHHCIGMDDDRVWRAGFKLVSVSVRQPGTAGPKILYLCTYHTEKLIRIEGANWIVVPLDL